MGILLIVLGAFIAFFGGITGFVIGVFLCGLGYFILKNPNIYNDAGVDTSECYDDDE